MNNQQIALIIKRTCKEKHVPISKLLADCNIRKGLIYDMEKRDQAPSVAILEQIAKYLGCSVDYLLGRGDQSTPTVSDGVGGEQKEAPTPETEDGLDEVERQIMSYVRTMNPAQKDTLVAFLRTTVSRNLSMPTSVQPSDSEAEQ